MGGLCYSGIKMSSVKVIAIVDVTTKEFIRDWSLR